MAIHTHARRAGLALAAAATLAYPLAGCSGESALRSNGETVVIHSQQEPDALNQIISDMVATVDATTPIMEGLTTPNDKLQIEPVLAETIPTLENGLVQPVGEGMVVTWPLRHGVKWHDGKPFTAEDVAFTYRVMMHPNTKVTTRQGYDKITKVEVLGPHRVRFTFSEVYAPHELLFGSILPEHLLGRYVADPEGDSINKVAYNRHPIGTGPFKFKEWASGDHITYEAFDGYWRGKPGVKAITMRIVPDENAAFTLLKAGELDVYQSASINQFDALKKLKHVTVHTQPALTWEHLDFNLKKPIFGDIRVRRAIAHAINKEQISEKIYQGLYPVAHSDMSPLNWAYNKAIENRYPYDPEKAKALLDAAGWKPGLDGIRMRDGARFRIKISTTAGRKPRELTELVLKYYMKKVGIELAIDNHPGPILFGPHPSGILKGGKFDLGMWAWSSAPDPDNFSLWHSSQVPPNGQNQNYFKSAEMDRLLEAGTKTIDREARKKIYRRAAQILSDEVPVIPLLYWANLNPANKRLQNFKPNPSNAGNLWNCYEWRAETTPVIKAEAN